LKITIDAKEEAAESNDTKVSSSIEEEASKILVSGLSPIPELPEIKPAQKASRRMEKLIHDQIDESKGSSEISKDLPSGQVTSLLIKIVVALEFKALS